MTLHHARPQGLQQLLQAADDADWQVVCSLSSCQVLDHYATVWQEWHKMQYPATRLNETQLKAAYDEEHQGLDPNRVGVYVYYPWLNTLVHLPEEKIFVEVRTNRNQNKITKAEQDHLSTRTVGVIGLSVGSSAARTLALERTAGTLVLADFDTLELSNLNRIQAGMQHLGLSKAMVTARQIAELDPFIKVVLYDLGLTKENLPSFINGGDRHGRLDLIVEECDDLAIKLLTRLEARTAGVPVVMETSDRGMLDIERFDLDPSLPLLHGLVAEPLPNVSAMSPAERMALVMKIIDYEHISNRLASSFAQIGTTLSTWPQLGSAIAMGGGVAADITRRILLGDGLLSGRYYIDLEQLVPTAKAVDVL